MNYMVYKTTNKINGKIYIGCHQTTNITDEYLGSGKLLKRAIEKYGKENFVREIIASFKTDKEMFDEEKILISKLKPEYNLHEGGNGGWKYVTENKLHINHSNRKNSLKNLELGRMSIKSERQISSAKNIMKKIHEKYSNGVFLGKRHSEESKKLIGEKNSIHQQGSNNSQFGTIWITNGLENRKIKKEDIIPEGWNRGRK